LIVTITKITPRPSATRPRRRLHQKEKRDFASALAANLQGESLEVPHQSPEVLRLSLEVPRLRPEVPRLRPVVPRLRPEVPRLRLEVPHQSREANLKGDKLTNNLRHPIAYINKILPETCWKVDLFN